MNEFTKEKVFFKNGIYKVAAELFKPQNFDENKKYPAFVICHPGGGVKEQTSALYAQGLAQKGYIAMTFDATHQGESEGEPRLLDNPYERSEDIRCGVDYFTTLPFVDRNRIGAIGSCAGSGYAIFAALTDRRIKTVCAICCTNPGATSRLGWDGKRSVEEQIKRLDEIAEQRTIEANGGDIKYLHYVPEIDEINENTHPDMIEANDYYRNEKRAKHQNSPNKFRLTGLANRMTFDAYEFIPDYLDRPFLIIAGSKAGSLWQSKKAYELSTGPKELYIVESAGHFDFYDNQKYIDMALDKMDEFFKKAFQ